MKLSQVDSDVLTKLFGKDLVDTLSGALKPEEGELSLGARINGRVITVEDEKNIRQNAEQQGKELRSKELAKALNIELSSGEKDPVKIAEKLTDTITESLEEKYKNPKPGEREIELEGKLKDSTSKYEALFKTHGDTLKDVTEKEEAYKGLEKKIQVKERNNTILKSFPEKMNMDRNDALLITVNAFEFDEQDNKSVIKRNGEIVRNGAGEPETYENVIKSYVEEKKWVKGNGMNGKDRDGNHTKKGLTSEQAEKAIIDSGKDPGSPEGLKAFLELTEKE